MIIASRKEVTIEKMTRIDKGSKTELNN